MGQLCRSSFLQDIHLCTAANLLPEAVAGCVVEGAFPCVEIPLMIQVEGVWSTLSTGPRILIP